jgi:hypothetical protein
MLLAGLSYCSLSLLARTTCLPCMRRVYFKTGLLLSMIMAGQPTSLESSGLLFDAKALIQNEIEALICYYINYITKLNFYQSSRQPLSNCLHQPISVQLFEAQALCFSSQTLFYQSWMYSFAYLYQLLYQRSPRRLVYQATYVSLRLNQD